MPASARPIIRLHQVKTNCFLIEITETTLLKFVLVVQLVVRSECVNMCNKPLGLA